MAITNAQQYKQLVNPPMEGKKRPGYRGDDAARSSEGTSAGRAAPPSSAPRGDGPKTNAPSQDRIAEIKQANQTLKLLEDDKAFEQQGFETLRVKDNNFPGFIGMGLNALKGPRQKLLDRNIDFFRNDPRTARAREKYGLTAQGYKDYMSARQAGNIDAAGNTIISEDDDNDNFIPVDTTFDMESGNTDQETTEDPFEISRRFRAEGGIMNSNVVGGEYDFDSARQMYGLGKLVKKIGRSVKKIAKSPIGKAALLGAAAFGIPGTSIGGLFGRASFMLPAGSGGVTGLFGKKGIAATFPSIFGGVTKMAPANAVKGAATTTPNIFQKALGLVKDSPFGAISAASAISGLLTADQEAEAQKIADETGIDIAEIRANPDKYLARRFRAEGRSMDEPVAKKTMPLLDMDGQEMDLRAEGGFVPIGRMEKADDVPARLSKNEFVFTAEAVRNAGEGDVDKGAEVMYNMMNNLESGGEVSEESQGLEGAREMFQTSQRLEEVI